MDMSQYLEIFIDESKEHLQGMNDILLDLEKNYENVDLLNEIFRTAHTIKGMSSTMGFSKVADLTHEMENVLHICRSKELAVDGTIIDILFECFDGLEVYVDNLAETGNEGELDTTDLVNRLKYIASNKSTAGLSDGVVEVNSSETGQVVADDSTVSDDQSTDTDFSLSFSMLSDLVIAEARENNYLGHIVKVTLDESCMLKAARAFIVFNTLEQFGEIVRSKPSAEDIEDEKFESAFEVMIMTKLDKEIIREDLMSVSEVNRIDIATVDFATETPEKVEESSVVQPEPSSEQPVANQSTTTPSDTVVNTNKNKKTDTKREIEKPKTGKTVRVDIDRLDNLMNLVSELIIIKTRLDDSDATESKQNLNETVEYLERITTSLHDAVMKVRMVPVERTFNRFPRMVRDLAKELDKSINLNMSGEDTEVDRTVIDEIGDPLIHLIRNSIDHGIENKTDRLAKGKSETGDVHLRAYPDGNSVVIEVEDDGNGIDSEKVAAKAIAKRLVSAEQVEAMSHHDLINMLFLPGFSTAEVITDLSGRGVGLDVVKTKIEALSGTVEVDSQLGKGSKFTIRLPLTLAIIQALMVNLSDEKYAIPLNSIRIITSINKADISLVQGQEVILYRNQALPLIHLPKVLEVPNHNNDADQLTVVIVRKGNQEAGLVVDGLIGQQEIVIKSLGKYLGGVKAIAGATILGNGGVALIIDPNQLF